MKECDIKRMFKDVWDLAKFPWVNLVVDPTTKIHMVCCKVCLVVEV